MFDDLGEDGFEFTGGNAGEVHQHFCDWIAVGYVLEEAAPKFAAGLDHPAFEVEVIGDRDDAKVGLVVEVV